MSDSSQGDGWWIASDGRWYPPEQHPDAAAPAAPAQPDGPEAIAPEPGGDAPAIAPAGRSRRGALVAAAAVVVLVVLIVAAVAIVASRGSETTVAVAEGGPVAGGGEPTEEIVLEPVGSAGTDPFTTAVTVREVTDFPSSVSKVVDERDAAVTVDDRTGTRVTAAATPGLYGGTTEESCDAAALAEFLAANPTIEAAWNGAIPGLDPAGTDAYLASLTPVVLTSDTRVTNHGLVDGVATPFQSVLQAGTAVLVDDLGVPVVRCSCGNPLAPPEPVDVRTASLAGTPWDTFRTDAVVTVQGGEPIETLTVVDTSNGTLVPRERPTPVSDAEIELITTGTSAGYGQPGPDIGIRVDGQDFLLETPIDPLVDALTAALGPPDVDQAHDYLVGCGTEEGDREAVPGRRIAWGGLWFQSVGGYLTTITMVGPEMASVVEVPEAVTEDPPWATDTGLGIGSPASDVAAVYPGYSNGSGLVGMSVSFTEGGDAISYLGLWLYMDSC